VAKPSRRRTSSSAITTRPGLIAAPSKSA
jgi:hypothetical protein